MKKRSLLLLGVITLGWVQPVCTAVAEKMETTPQEGVTETETSADLKDEPVSSTEEANKETTPSPESMNPTSTEEKGTTSSTTTRTQQTSEDYSTNKVQELTVKNENVTNGSWGTAPYQWDASRGVLTIGKGALQKVDYAPYRNGIMQLTDVKEIVFTDPVIAPPGPSSNNRGLFQGLRNMTAITGLTNLDTRKVTDMRYMFMNANSLTDVDLSGFNTGNVTNMYAMFYGASSLTNVDFSTFNTSNVTDMSYMFTNASSLTNVDFSTFNTSNVTSMQSMFMGASSLTSLDLSTFDTSNVINMGSMFSNASSLTSLDLSTFDTSNVTDMGYMFSGATKLQSLKLGQAFKFIGSNVNLPSPPTTEQYTGKWQNLGSGTKDFPTGKNIGSASGFMSNYNGSKDADTYVWQPAGTGLWGTAPYQWNKSTGTLTVGTGDLQQVDYAPWKGSSPVMKPEEIKELTFDGKAVAPVNSDYLFYGLTNVSSINQLVHLDTSKVTTMDGMFGNTPSLTSLDLSSFHTEKVTSMVGMFNGASALTRLTFGDNFDTSNVTNMNSMFASTGLTSLDLSKFDTQNVMDMGAMFINVKNLTKLDLSTFNTSSVTNMSSMFSGASGLTQVKFGDTFDTSKVTKMNFMFYGNKSLTSLDLSSFNTRNVTDMGVMFSYLTALQSLKLGKDFTFIGNIDADLPNPPDDNKTAGKWRNIGSGTQKKPLGKNLWTGRELMTKYNGETDADTYVWQPTGISIDLVSESFSFPNVKISGKKQTVAPTEKAKLSLTDALPKNYSGTQLLVSYETPDDEWQKTGFSLKIKPSTTQTYIQTAEVQVSPDATPIITQFDESKKQGGTIVDLDLSPELTVPQSLTAKNYSTTIVWTIQQGPK